MYTYVYKFVSVFSTQKKLTTLDIAANRIKRIENISHLTELQEFWVRVMCEEFIMIVLNSSKWAALCTFLVLRLLKALYATV